mmetsp:Transcript_485/g.1018  ORF Transcript_485/g.1018 Transcript_485/m.1018 type:complete len:246 (+) Transcript_485:317-1054(+)
MHRTTALVIAVLSVLQVDGFSYRCNGRSIKQITHKPHRNLRTTQLKAAVPSWLPYSVCHLAGGCTGTPIVMRATRAESSWYKRIPLPSFTPPNWVFAPVWTTLYGLMGVAVSRVVRAGTPMDNAVKLWTVHYGLNLLWAPLFFGLQRFKTALGINIMLLATLAGVLKQFYLIDPLSAYLLAPYLLWLSYATVLNWAVCRLNPTVNGNNKAKIQAGLCAFGDGYNDAMFQYDLKQLQIAAASYADT